MNCFKEMNEKEHLDRVLISPKFSGKFTEACVAYQHWAPVQTDHNYWRTAVSCYSAACMQPSMDGNEKQILFYLVFPSLGVAVPMKSRDTVVFDSSFPHCASNYQVDDTIMVSFVANANTLHTQIKANHHHGKTVKHAATKGFGHVNNHHPANDTHQELIHQETQEGADPAADVQAVATVLPPTADVDVVSKKRRTS
jgi:hypothetical protein